ncbi:MAG: hypothetical protein JWR76_2556 [Mucilaginibacter sp.]|jgi:hypothetical protein|nr:hypothetical protein [Mucilaginibacter sp.]
MSTSAKKIPVPDPNGDPKANRSERDAITNKDEAKKVVNKDGADGAVADMDGIQEILSDTEPSTALNADASRITDDQTASGDTATDAEIAGDKSVI